MVWQRRLVDGLRKKFVQLILWAIVYSSVAYGVLPFKYDGRARKLKRSKWLIAYGILLNLVLFALLFVREEDDQPLQKELFTRNPLTEIINTLSIVFDLLVVLVSLVRCWWHSQELCSILNQLMRLHRNFFQRFALDLEQCVEFEFFVIHKGLLTLLEMISALIIEIGIDPIPSWQFYLGVLAICLVQINLLLTGLHFHLAVSYIYRYIWIINRQLLRLANQLSVGVHDIDMRQLHALLRVYRRLLELNERLNAIFDYQSALLMVVYMGANILLAFFAIVLNFSLKKMSPFIAFIVFPQAGIINSVDLWCTFATCNALERAGQATSRILKLFSDFNGLNLDLERTVETFALFCSHRRSSVSHCGMFIVNNALGFRLFVAGAMYLVFLVQSDFMNL